MEIMATVTESNEKVSQLAMGADTPAGQCLIVADETIIGTN